MWCSWGVQEAVCVIVLVLLYCKGKLLQKKHALSNAGPAELLV